MYLTGRESNEGFLQTEHSKPYIHSLFFLISLKAAMDHDGVDGILDKKLVGKCKIEEVRKLAKIGHKCIHNTPKKRPSIGEVSQALSSIRHRRLLKEKTMSFSGSSISRALSRLEEQHVELSRMTTMAH